MTRLARITAKGFLLMCVLAQAPAPTRACSGETPTLEAITSTAWLIAEFEVISVGPEVSVDVPGSFVTRVHRVLKGSAPPVMSFEWPTPVGICDGYIATVGDRFFMAFGARPFPAGGPYNALWPIRVTRDSAGSRGDLSDLLAIAALGDPPESSLDEGSFSWLPFGLGIALIAGLLVFMGRRSRGPPVESHGDR